MPENYNFIVVDLQKESKSKCGWCNIDNDLLTKLWEFDYSLVINQYTFTDFCQISDEAISLFSKINVKKDASTKADYCESHNNSIAGLNYIEYDGGNAKFEYRGYCE